MKYLLIVLIIAMEIAVYHGDVRAENWGNWGNWKNQKGSETEKKYCPPEQQKELLELLAELDDPSLSKKAPGGRSEVRRKYRIAKKLRKFDDCRAEDALKKLMKENACEDTGEDEVFCVKWGASLSLQEVSSKKDLEKLTPELPLEEQLKIIKKYGPHPHKNDFASHAVMGFLIMQADTNPDVYIPLLVEYFTLCHEILPIIGMYPKATNKGLLRCLNSSESTVVWTGINLARTLKKKELLGEVYDVAFGGVGKLDYTQQDDIEEIRSTAIALFRMFEKEAMPYYRGILYSDFQREKEFVISGIRDLASPDLYTLLREFYIHLQNTPDTAKSLLAQRVLKKISKMEAAQK